jgi:signal transduction histidine kinase
MELIDRIKTDSPTINPVAIDLRFKLQQIKDIFSIQMEDKGVNFQIYTSQVENYYVYCDNNRLQRMLLNLISLAYDFTPSGGNILVSLTQSGLAYRKTEQNGDCNYSMACADYELHIQHTGASITKEFIDDAYTNYRKLELMNIDKPEQNIAITKHLVQLINGTIEIESDQEKGTDITIRFTLNLAKQSAVTDVYDEAALMYQ